MPDRPSVDLVWTICTLPGLQESCCLTSTRDILKFLLIMALMWRSEDNSGELFLPCRSRGWVASAFTVQSSLLAPWAIASKQLSSVFSLWTFQILK